MKKVAKALYYLLLAVIIVIAILLILSGFSVGGMKMFVVKSGSMQPTIKTGSVVIVSPAATYQTGDIVTFGPISKTAEPTTHRIIEETDGGFVTKGDANNTADRRIIANRDILGKVRLSLPFAGYAVAAAKKPLGFTVIIIIPAIVIIGDEIRKIWQEAKNLRKKNRLSNVPPELIPQKKEDENNSPKI